MKQAAAYILSAYSFIFTDSLDKLLDTGYQSRDGNPIPSFDENLLIELCNEAQLIFEKEKNVLEIEGEFIIVGDIHGSLHDLLRILKFIQEKQSKVLFLGDYVDRGCFSLECITILLALKVIHPDIFYLIRGNHEFESLCRQYGFKNELITFHNPQKHEQQRPEQEEVKMMKKSKSLTMDTITQDDEFLNDYYQYHSDLYHYKYTEELYNSFIKTFSYLPIAAVINKTTFCIHGGLSPKLDHVDTLNKMITRPINNFEDNELLSDVIWSDPSYSLDIMYDENPRGRGYLFNGETVANFLKNNSLVRIIRGHQCVINGSLINFHEKCITVFSASSYDRFMQNHSSVLQLFQKDDTIQVSTFEPLERLQKSDAFYIKVQTLKDDRLHPCFSLTHPILCTSLSVLNASKYFSGQKNGNSKSVPMIKPRFTTNPRKSCGLVKKPALKQNCQMDFFENDRKKRQTIDFSNL